MKFRFPFFALAMALILLLSGCSLPTGETAVESITLTDQVDERTKAALHEMSSFPAGTQRVYASVKVANGAGGTKVEAEWSYKVEGEQFRVVDAAAYTFDQAASRHVAFSLASQENLPPGSYKVKIKLNDQVVEELSFTVEQ